MKHKKKLSIGMSAALALTALSIGAASPAPDKYTVKVPGGLAFSEFRGYEKWEVINLSNNNGALAAILGNPAMIAAFKAGIPANGKPVPDGARMAKIHWKPKVNVAAPGSPTVAGEQMNVDFMVKDAKRFADSGGWGYAVFEYDAATDTFRPGDQKSQPPQANDAKCGFACHTIVKNRDFVFTEYAKR
jgi:hypothetical protein